MIIQMLESNNYETYDEEEAKEFYRQLKNFEAWSLHIRAKHIIHAIDEAIKNESTINK